MITCVDTNVLIDVFGMDPEFGFRSAQALRECLKTGSLHASEVVWIEAASMFPDHDKFLSVMEQLGIEYSGLTKESALLAAGAWRAYVKSGGPKRARIAADFLIGAHALQHGGRLLTRDRGFFRTYFKSLTVIDPAAA